MVGWMSNWLVVVRWMDLWMDGWVYRHLRSKTQNNVSKMFRYSTTFSSVIIPSHQRQKITYTTMIQHGAVLETLCWNALFILFRIYLSIYQLPAMNEE
jgi:hypothetical protein